jgi:hypothetical protein
MKSPIIIDRSTSIFPKPYLEVCRRRHEFIHFCKSHNVVASLFAMRSWFLAFT